MKPSSFEEIYRQHIGLVQFAVSRFRFPPQIQEELIQDVFLRYLECPKAHDNPKGFLMSVARNLAIDFYRRQKRRGMDHHRPVEEMQHEMVDPQDGPLRLQLTVVQDFLESIRNHPQATTLVQYYDEDLSIKEIAARSQESIATVSSRLSRQRKKYRAALEERLDSVHYG